MTDLIDLNPSRVLDANGDSVAGALATFFASGTSNAVTVYTDLAESVPHASPVVADGSGVFPAVYYSGGALKVVITGPNGETIPGSPIDPVQKSGADQSGADAITITPTTLVPETNVQAALNGIAERSEADLAVVSGDLSDLETTLSEFNSAGTPQGRLGDARSIPESLEALGIGARRVDYRTDGRVFTVMAGDFTPGCFHYATPSDGEVIYIDTAGLDLSETYRIYNAGEAGGTIHLDCESGAQLYFLTNGSDPNATSVKSIDLDAGESVALVRIGGSIIRADITPSSLKVAAHGSYYERKADGTYKVRFTRTSAISAGLTSDSNYLDAGFSLRNAVVSSIAFDADGTNPPPMLPHVTKIGTAHSLTERQFGIYNPNTVSASGFTITFEGVEKETFPDLVRSRHFLIAGQSYGREGYFSGGAYGPFAESIVRAFIADPTSIQSRISGSPTIAAGQTIKVLNEAVDGSAVLAKHDGGSGYWLENDGTTSGPLLTDAVASITADALGHTAVVYSHGEQDAGSTATEALAVEVASGMGVIINALREAENPGNGGGVPCFVDMIGPRFEGNEFNEYRLRDAMIDEINAQSRVFFGAEKYAVKMDSTTHPSEDFDGYAQLGAHAGRKAAYWLENGLTLDGPSISTASSSGSTVAVTITVPSGGTLQKPTNPKFFGFFDGNDNRIEINSVVWSGNTATFTLASEATTLRYPARDTEPHDIGRIVRLQDPTDPIYPGEPGLVLESTKTITL